MSFLSKTENNFRGDNVVMGTKIVAHHNFEDRRAENVGKEINSKCKRNQYQD